jgi:GNAT superfamily N-acetyltransferase
VRTLIALWQHQPATRSRFRQQRAPDLFLGAFVPQAHGRRKLIGYICSTLSSSEILTHDSMFTHVDGAQTVCIHAICVEMQSRQKGIATQLLKEYINRFRARAEAGSVPYKRIVLIAHDNLIAFYENAGFRNLGKSQVVHGSLPWYQLSIDLNNTAMSVAMPSSSVISQASVPLAEQGQPIPDGLLDALLRSSSSRNRPSGKLLSSFENGLDDVAIGTTTGESLNKFDLLCPRQGCGSVILKKEVAQQLQRTSEAVGTTMRQK